MTQVQEAINNNESGLKVYDPQKLAGRKSSPVVRNRDRTQSQLALHSDISSEVSGNAKKAKDFLVSGPINSSATILRSGIKKVKNVMSDLQSPDISANTIRMKKYGMLALAGGFGLFTATSALGLLKSVFSRDESNKLLKFADVFLKFVMTLGIGGAALDKGPFKFKNSTGIIGGSILAILLNQFKGVNSGEQNVLGKLAKLTGTEETIKNGTQLGAGLKN